MLFQLVHILFIGKSRSVYILLKIILTLVLRVNQVKKTVDPRCRSWLARRYFLLSLDFHLSGLVRNHKLLMFTFKPI